MAFTMHRDELATLRDGRATLRDGREVLIGRLRPADAPLLADAFARLSQESRRLRFLGPKPRLSASELRYLTEVDGHRHEALTAIDPASGRGVAIARFVRNTSDPGRAEVAITVADDWQHRGLGKLMLTRLADRAREEGVRRFTALVSTDNRNMQNLLRTVEAPERVSQIDNGVAEYEIELAHRGLGRQLEEALRAAAAGHFQLPPPAVRAAAGPGAAAPPRPLGQRQLGPHVRGAFEYPPAQGQPVDDLKPPAAGFIVGLFAHGGGLTVALVDHLDPQPALEQVDAELDRALAVAIGVRDQLARDELCGLTSPLGDPMRFQQPINEPPGLAGSAGMAREGEALLAAWLLA